MRRLNHKYKAVRTERHGIRFDSKLEARVYDRLLLAKEAGEIVMILRQVPLHLPGNTVYRVDFQVFWANGEVSFIDAKGVETETFKLKKRQVEELYPIEIEIWKK